jgi:hypothetical protein
MYLSTAIDFARDSGNINNNVVPTAYITLKVVIPESGYPVVSTDTPKLLHAITNSCVTITNKCVK